MKLTIKIYRNKAFALPIISLLLGVVDVACAQDTGFTYQGRLATNGVPATNVYDLRFNLYADDGSVFPPTPSLTSPVNINDIGITGGLFTVTLDFGASFDGSARWLEVGVRPGTSSGSYATLSPRQKINPTPYAIRAANYSGTIASGQLGGVYSGAVTFSNVANSFSGIGSGLTGVNAATLGGYGFCSLPCYWKLTGNAGTSPAGNFLGTTDYQPLELKVNNQRVLRLEPTASIPNFIAGSSDNSVSLGFGGGAIGGGATNVIGSTFGTIGGGSGNTIRFNSDNGTIGGGAGNLIAEGSRHATISGGNRNIVYDSNGTIAGGEGNDIDYGSSATIAGGEGNRVGLGVQADYAAIGGGRSNLVAMGSYDTIGGGFANKVLASVYPGTSGGTISGGRSNSLAGDGATISGGNLNSIIGANSTVGGGYSNIMNSVGSIIGGGIQNLIYDSFETEGSMLNTIGGGASNSIQSGTVGAPAVGNTISGGTGNGMGWRIFHNTIGGGTGNSIVSDSARSTIGGGYQNKLDGTAGTIAGGFRNEIDAYAWYAGSIGGGNYNLIQNSDMAVIGGGYTNSIGSVSSYSTIAGGASNRVEGSTMYATIPGGTQARASRHGQLVYASGQFAATGDAQTSIQVCRATTTTATPAELFLDGASERMVIAENSTWTYDILVTGRTSGGNSAGYQIRGVIENNAGTTALVGSPNVLVLAEDVVAWDAIVAADNVNDALVVRVTGAAATTIRWVATVRTVEVTY